ncbi:MAG: HDOD domain-containing protein [Chloroflexi bacterium]|nr:HDOD domain-containing protein [Chloroflexota bacterium]
MTEQEIMLQKLLDAVQDLPPLPQAAMKILQLIQEPDSTMIQLAEVLTLDEALMSRVLTWANSPYYVGYSPVSTIEQAMMRLGLNTLRQLVLAATTTNFLGRPVSGYAMMRGDLWRHSIAVAAGARTVMAREHKDQRDQAYVAGLLHDVGKLVCDAFANQPGFWPPLEQEESGQDVEAFDKTESRLLGIDHAHLGAEVARKWNLPDTLCDAIAWHHDPSRATDGALLAAAVHVADAAALMAGIGLGIDGLEYCLDMPALHSMGWLQEDMENLMNEEYQALHWAEEFLREGR